MDIICSIDNNYVQHCCVMLSSFFENNAEREHSIHLLTEGLSSESKKTIQHLVNTYRGKFFYYQVDSDLLKHFPIRETDHVTIATYYRLIITEILPPNLHKVLYLDCDIVINSSLRELWSLSIKDYAIGAVEELGCSLNDVYDRLKYDRNFGYFNAGVLLINLDYWRRNHLAKIFSDYIFEHAADLKAHDQDTLNALLHDKCLHIPLKWNVEEAFYHYTLIKRLKRHKELRAALCTPAILHYTWKPKPWEANCKHPFRINYYKYLKKTPMWKKAFFPLRQRLRAIWDKIFFRFLLKTGITGHRFYRI